MPKIGQQRPAAFQFGIFELNPHTRELRKLGVKLKLQGQPLQILVLLLEHPGEIVTREEIQKWLWPLDTYVDFDKAINSAMRKLRDALGDSADNPRFIETVARRGYRFIAPVLRPVAVGRDQAITGTSKEQIEPAVPKDHFRWAVPAAIAGMALAGIGLGVWIAKNKATQPPAPPAPLTSYAGFQLFPSFSPDGTRVAFSWGDPGKQPSNIYVKMIGPGQPLRLTRNPSGDFAPVWSPDGRFIAFLRAIDHQRSAVIAVPANSRRIWS